MLYKQLMITFNISSFSNPINETDFGIPVPALKAILIPYFIINILFGLLGNSIVIRSTYLVDVWRFEESLITLLRYLAFTDAGLTLLHILPQFVSLVADSWILREVGVVIAFVRYPLFMMEMSLVLALSLIKLYLIRNPFHSGSHTTVLVIKIVFPLLFVFFLVVDFSKIVRCYMNENISCYSYYKPSLLRCTFKTDDRFGGLLKIVYGLVVMFLLVLANLAIIFEVWKSLRVGEKGRMKSIAVVSVVCWIFIISYLPFLLISTHLNIHANSEIVYFASEQFVNLSITSNPIVYTLLYRDFFQHVVRSFGIGRVQKGVVRSEGREITQATVSDNDL